MKTNKPLITAKQVNFKYPNSKVIFNGFSLEINRGEVVCVVGESGCGKTTLLKILAGLENPQSGNVIHNCSTKNGFVFQTPVLMDWLDVVGNIVFPEHKRDVSNLNIDVPKLLAEIELEGAEKKHPRELSGGMRARVQLARALYNKADVLFLDEAFSGLDEKLRLQMALIVKNARLKHQCAIVLISHSLSEAVFLADKLLILEREEDDPVHIQCVTEGLTYSSADPSVMKSDKFIQTVNSLREMMV